MAHYSCNYADCHGCVMRGMLLVVAILLTALSTSDGGSEYFAPGGTRLISYDTPVFCQSLKMKDRSSKYPATLYLLSDRPQLTGHDEFNMSYNYQTINSKEYVYLKYFLYPGSNFSLSYCFGGSKHADFYIIRNESNFRSWVSSHDLKYTVHHTTINNTCDPYGWNIKKTHYNITSTEQYYFVYYNPSAHGLQVLAGMTFWRTLYNVTSSEIVKHCEAGPHNTRSNRLTCSVDVPLDSHYSTLIVVGTPQGTNYNNTVHIEWHCSPHVWLYAVIVCTPVLVVAACVAAVTIVCCCWLLRRKKRKYQPLLAARNVRPRSADSLNSDHRDTTTLPERPRHGTVPGEASDSNNISDATNPLRPPPQEVLDAAPMERKNLVRSSESAVIAGAAALL